MYVQWFILVTCVLLAGYILLMTQQLKVLKQFGHVNFDGNRSAEWKRFFHLSLFGWSMGTCMGTWKLLNLLGLPFSPQGAGLNPWWVSLTLCLVFTNMLVLWGLCKPVYVPERPEKAVFTSEEMVWKTSRPVEVPGNFEKAVYTTFEILWSQYKPLEVRERCDITVFTAEEVQ